jgi:hypothetical protein
VSSAGGAQALLLPPGGGRVGKREVAVM